MQFEMNHKIGTDYSTVKFTAGIYDTIKFKLPVIESFETSFSRLGGIFCPDEGYVWKFPSFIASQVLQEVIHNTCFVCGGLMKNGQAIQEGKMFVSSYDSGVDTYQVQIEYPNPNDSKVIKVRKCSACGHSHT